MKRDYEEVIRDLKHGISELDKSIPVYATAEAYYEGDDPELFISESLHRHLREEVTAFRLNMAAVPVDSVADRLYISAFVSQDEQTQAEIDRIVSENQVWNWANDLYS